MLFPDIRQKQNPHNCCNRLWRLTKHLAMPFSCLRNKICNFLRKFFALLISPLKFLRSSQKKKCIFFHFDLIKKTEILLETEKILHKVISEDKSGEEKLISWVLPLFLCTEQLRKRWKNDLLKEIGMRTKSYPQHESSEKKKELFMKEAKSIFEPFTQNLDSFSLLILKEHIKAAL